ncbi:transposase [Dolichospermum sp. UHCC 0315A]|uniref:transposase n=1 Tax=Dolichospermum sp. UHCC 0315A TaxID=1914871 RepID=UPI001FF067D9|nr:transposase [Dolichospermum sp. UHCC 0315A]
MSQSHCESSFFFLAALKDWAKHQGKYLGQPKMPRYKHKERGRNIVIYPIDAISKPALTKGIVRLSQSNIQIPTIAGNVDQVRIVPKLNYYVIEVVYTVDEPVKSTGKYSAGIDLGLNNLMAITSNHSGIKPLLINGRPLKSINQFFNKRVAKAQSVDPNFMNGIEGLQFIPVVLGLWSKIANVVV